MKALGLVVSEKKIFFLCFNHDPPPPVRGLYEPQGHGEDFLCFSYDAPGAGPVWTPGARLAGFIKRTTTYCYIQKLKALGHVVSEKKIFLCFAQSRP